MDFEAEVIKRVQAGDSEAFAYLVKRYEGALFVLAGNLLSPSHRAEDLVQEVFLSAFQHIRRYDPRRGAFSSWLFAVAANAYRSHMRRHRLFMLPLDAARDTAQPRSAALDHEQEGRELLVRHAVSTLPDRYRDVFVLFYFHQMDVQETARSLGLAEGTVKKQLFRAVGRMRDNLAPLLGANGPEG